MHQRKGTVVVGIGNALMTDEGVGVAVVRGLMSSPALSGEVDFVEAGTSLMAVVHAIAGRRKAVLVDCACMDEGPGTIRRFSPDMVVSRKGLDRLSLHEGDVLEALKLSQRLGEYPGELVVYGIQPQSVEPGETLSPALRDRIDEYVTTVSADLNGLGRPQPTSRKIA
jgi:hydrogenase maturation protease